MQNYGSNNNYETPPYDSTSPTRNSMTLPRRPMIASQLSSLYFLLKLAILRDYRGRRDIFGPILPRELTGMPAQLPRGFEPPSDVVETPEWERSIKNGWVKAAPYPKGRWALTAKGEKVLNSMMAELWKEVEY